MSVRFLAHVGMALGALFCAFFAFSPAVDTGFSAADLDFLEHGLAASTVSATLSPPWVPPFERPLSQLAFAGEVSLFGLRAPRYVVAHTVLQALNATLLFALFRGPLGSPVAAGAAILYALAFGFYGESVWRPSQLGILLATLFVLGTGSVALRAQLERTPRRRLAATLLTAFLFFLAILCHEAGIMALVMLGGLMWPHRRSLSSVLRKLAMLVVLAAGAVVIQLVRGHGAPELLLQASTWLALPVRALRLLSLIVLPVGVEPTAPAPDALLPRVLALLEQIRPITGLFFAAIAALWFFKGSGAVRWLLASLFAFLIPLGLHAATRPRLDLGEACLPAAFLCGAIALGFYQLWHRVGSGRRLLLGVALIGLLYGDLAVVRRFASDARVDGQSDANQVRLQALLARQVPPPTESR